MFGQAFVYRHAFDLVPRQSSCDARRRLSGISDRVSVTVSHALNRLSLKNGALTIVQSTQSKLFASLSIGPGRKVTQKSPVCGCEPQQNKEAEPPLFRLGVQARSVAEMLGEVDIFERAGKVFL
jgi:hypothetical protein